MYGDTPSPCSQMSSTLVPASSKPMARPLADTQSASSATERASAASAIPAAVRKRASDISMCPLTLSTIGPLIDDPTRYARERAENTTLMSSSSDPVCSPRASSTGPSAATHMPTAVNEM